MKYVSDGKIYDTESSTALAVHFYQDDDGLTFEETLYLSPAGNLFRVMTWKCEDGLDRAELATLDEKSATHWLSTNSVKVLSDKLITLPGINLEFA